jgi:RNA-directed DNA polymerase
MDEQFLKISNRRELATYLGYSYKKFSFILFKLSEHENYKIFKIRKRNGGERIIHAPRGAIRFMQERIKLSMESFYRPRKCSHGYVQNRGIKSCATMHTRKRHVVNVDLKGFFQSIHFGRVYGLFKAPPFNFNNEVASTLARICTCSLGLPTGGVTSPIISNMICMRLDNDLIEFAKNNNCYYTRYADDLTFSTKQRECPKAIATEKNIVGKFLTKIFKNGSEFSCGDDLGEIIKSHGFEVNKKKTRIMGKHTRQEVTGLVVNRKVNVNKKYISQLKGMLHACKKYGIESVGKRYLEKYELRNRTPFMEGKFDFESVLIGKVLHLRDIKGRYHPTYIKLAMKLDKVSRKFHLNKEDAYHPEWLRIRLFVEGKTDIYVFGKAFKYFKDKGEFKSLKIDINRSSGFGGEAKLFGQLEKLKGVDQTSLTIAVFDNDIDLKKLKDVSGKEEVDIQRWSHGLYSMTLPVPPSRSKLDWEKMCLETYFNDSDLKRFNSEGRRIYTYDEFHNNGELRKNCLVTFKYFLRKKSYIVDNNVFGKIIDNQNTVTTFSCALAKNDFAIAVSNAEDGFKNIEFENFRVFFEKLEEIQKYYLNEMLSKATLSR